jgi:hypothetical protein
VNVKVVWSDASRLSSRNGGGRHAHHDLEAAVEHLRAILVWDERPVEYQISGIGPTPTGLTT